jgi:hypothetical protein
MSTLQQERKNMKFTAAINNNNTECTLSIKNSWAVDVDFNYHGNPYTISVATNSQSLNKALRLYLTANPTDARFGVIDAANGDNLIVTSDQKEAFALEMSKHMILCLSQLLVEQGRHILDYAVWYREKTTTADDYSSYIQKIVCHFIVHEDFISGTAKFEKTAFTYQ